MFKTKRDPAAGLLKPGVYRFTVESSKASTGGEYPGANLQLRPIVNGQKHQSIVFENLSTSPKSEWRVSEFMDAIGAPNEEGEVGADWFRGKVGWARFYHQEDQDGKLQVKVKKYLTETQAERNIERQIEEGQEDSGAVRVQTRRNSRPAPEPEPETKTRGKNKPSVLDEHGADEDIPF